MSKQRKIVVQGEKRLAALHDLRHEFEAARYEKCYAQCPHAEQIKCKERRERYEKLIEEMLT